MYRWTQSEPFRDHANDRVVAEGEVVEIADAIAGPQPGFVPVDEPPDDDSGSEDDSAESDVDYAALSYDELRQMAADADTDEINGRSGKDEIVAYFSDE